MQASYVIKLRDICRLRGHNKTDALYNHVCYKIIHSPSYFAKALLSSGTCDPKVVIKILKRNIHWLYVLKFGKSILKIITLLSCLLPCIFFLCCSLSKSYLWLGQTLNLACPVFLIWYIYFGPITLLWTSSFLVLVLDSAFRASVWQCFCC